MKNIHARNALLQLQVHLNEVLSPLPSRAWVKLCMAQMLWLLWCACWLLLNVAWAGDADGGFVWKVHKRGQPVSYLIGTVHLGKQGAVLPPAYARIVKTQTTLMVESNEDDWKGAQGQRLQRQMATLVGASVPLKDSVGTERIKQINALLHRNGSSLRLQADEHMAPWMAWMAMATDYNMPGYSMNTGIDVLLLQAAKARKHNIVALETLEPLYIFKRIPTARLLRAIDADLQDAQAAQQEQVQMLRYYHAGNSKDLVAKILDADDAVKHYPKQDRQFWKQWMFGDLLQQRNVAWLPKIEAHLQAEPTVVAVGAAHLFGGSGLIVLLRERGYVVTPYRI